MCVINNMLCTWCYKRVRSFADNLDCRSCLLCSPHGIAIPLFFLFYFLFFFSTPHLRDHWTDLNQTWTNIHLWLLFEKIWSGLPRPLTPHGLGQKTAFGDRLWTLTEHISAKEHHINNQKNLSIYRDSPTCPKIWWTLTQQRLASSCPPLLLHFGRHCQPHNRQQANFGTYEAVARAYSL